MRKRYERLHEAAVVMNEKNGAPMIYSDVLEGIVRKYGYTDRAKVKGTFSEITKFVAFLCRAGVCSASWEITPDTNKRRRVFTFTRELNDNDVLLHYLAKKSGKKSGKTKRKGRPQNPESNTKPGKTIILRSSKAIIPQSSKIILPTTPVLSFDAIANEMQVQARVLISDILRKVRAELDKHIAEIEK